MAKKPFTLQGDRALEATLLELGKSQGGAVLDGSMRRGMNVIRGDVRARAMKLRQARTPGGKHLDQGIVLVKDRGRPRDNPMFRIGGTKRARYLMHLVEYGTAPHWQPKRQRMHPGARPKPFVRPAFEAKKNVAVKLILTDLKDKTLRKAAQLRQKNRNKR